MYKIANLVIDFTFLNSKGTDYFKRWVPFCTNEKKFNISYNIKFQTNITLPNPQTIIFNKENLMVSYVNEKAILYHIADEKPYAMTIKNTCFDYQIAVSKDSFENYLYPYFMSDLLHLEFPLLYSHNIVLHSSYIASYNEAILFTAPSGGGKSTQAELWKKYKNAEIVNGDKSIIGKENGKWYAYGIPFSGSSEYCLNRTCALKAIVILDKGPLNTLIPVGIRGFSNVFSQVTVNPWDKEFCNKAMDLVMDVCNEVPIYYYSCTKTPEAVEVLYQEFIEKGILNGSV